MKKSTIRGGIMMVGIMLAGFATAEIHIDESAAKKDAEDTNKPRIAAAEAGVCAIEMACATYFIEQGEMPTNLMQLVVGDNPFLDGGKDALYDPWMNNYEMEIKGGKIVIKSAGEDGVMGTSDDILSSNVRKMDGGNRDNYIAHGINLEILRAEEAIACSNEVIERCLSLFGNAYDILSELIGTEACPSNCYCDAYRRENVRIDIYSPENQFLAQYWDVDEDDAQSDGCTDGGCSFGYQYPPLWREKNLFTNRVEYARIVDDIIASNDVISTIRKASMCNTYDSGTNEVDTSALISVVRGYCCARIYRMVEKEKMTRAILELGYLVNIGEQIIKGRASIDEKRMAMAIIRNAQEVARLSIPFLSKRELSEVDLLFKLDCLKYGVDMHEDIVRGYLRNDMLRIEIAETLRRRFGEEWSEEIAYLHRRIMTSDENVCTAFVAKCYREGIGVDSNIKRADEMEACAVRCTHEKMGLLLRNNHLIPASDDDKKKGWKWSMKHHDGCCDTDAWGRQFKWKWSSKEGYVTVRSSGIDGKWGTKDDLVKTVYADTPKADERK